MNALDVLVTPRAPSAAPGAAEAAPAAGEADSAAGAFIALLGAMLGAKPVVELKPAEAPLALPLGESGDAAVEGEATQSEAGTEAGVQTPMPAPTSNGNALVSDSELVGIARAALAIMKRNAAATRSAQAAARASTPVGTIPLAQLARNAARKAEQAAGDVPKVKGSEKQDGKRETPVVEVAPPEASTSLTPPALPGATTIAAIPVAMMAEALSAATAAVRLPVTQAGDVTESSAENTDSTTAPRPSASAAPLIWTSAPATSAAHTTSGATDSALVNAVTQLIDALTPAVAAESGSPAPIAGPEITATTAESLANPAPASTTTSGNVALPASVTVESIEVAAVPATVSQAQPVVKSEQLGSLPTHLVVTMPDSAQSAPSAVPATLAAPAATEQAEAPVMRADVASLEVSEGHEVTAPKEGGRPRDAAPALAATTTGGQSRDHDASGQEPSHREHERPARKATTTEAAPQWSPAAHAPAPAPVASDEKPMLVTDVAGPRAPEEPTRTPQATSHVTLQLDKDTLGASRIRVAVRGDTVRATILADDSRAAALTAQLPELRRALEERGFTEARVVIQVEGNHEHQGTVIAGAVTDDLRARPAASARSESGREEQQPRGGRRQDPDGDRPRDRRRQAPREETQ